MKAVECTRAWTCCDIVPELFTLNMPGEHCKGKVKVGKTCMLSNNHIFIIQRNNNDSKGARLFQSTEFHCVVCRFFLS